MSIPLLLRRRCRAFLAILIFIASVFQFHIAVTQHDHAATLDMVSSTSQSTLPLKVTLPPLLPPPNTLISSSAAKTTNTTKPPRILIGIFSNAHSTSAQYKQHHLQLFALWNDTRLCSITQIHSNCQVIYAFIYGSTNTTLPPYANPIAYAIHPPDSVQLHILETMNEGKTPAFFQWAVTQSSTLFSGGVDYIFKCDSDSFLRWNALLRYLYIELPFPTTPTVVGMFRHKASWTNATNETLWKQEWYAGMHLYLAGQLYGMTVDVAQLLMQEANQGMPRPYFAGHEDHDATSMIQVIHTPPPPPHHHHHNKPYHHLLRWISVSKNHTFWEHPVKGGYRWQRILRREQRHYRQRLEGTRPIVPEWQPILASWTRKPSIVLIFLNPKHHVSPQDYLQEWKARNPTWNNSSVCGIHLFETKTQSCDLYYVFVQGVNPKGPKELLSNELLVDRDDEKNDTWNFPMTHKIHHGLVTTTLYWMHQQNLVEPFDYILVLTNNSLYIQVDAWSTIAVQVQPSRHHATLLGELRDKSQSPREFPFRGIESYWWEEYDNIHLYLASDCFAIGSRLVPRILEQAISHAEARQKYWENSVGHDITVLAYMIPKTALQWVPITNSLRFWES